MSEMQYFRVYEPEEVENLETRMAIHMFSTVAKTRVNRDFRTTSVVLKQNRPWLSGSQGEHRGCPMGICLIIIHVIN